MEIIIADLFYLPYSINIKYLLSTYYVLGTILASLNKLMNKAYKILLPFLELLVRVGMAGRKKVVGGGDIIIE